MNHIDIKQGSEVELTHFLSVYITQAYNYVSHYNW